jgi:hypothetical protein
MIGQLIMFLNRMVLEKELVMSASLYTLLRGMKHPIANIIIDIHRSGTDIGDNSYIDVNDNIGNITMLSSRRAERLSSEEIWNPNTSSRASTGVGKLVRSLLLSHGYINDNGNLKKDGQDDIKGRDIELFVNEFKALQQETLADNTDKNIKLVSGEEIRKWYHYSSYKYQTGTLGKSCMRYDNCQKYLDIYCNESKVKLLIYTEIDSRGVEVLLARALVWEGVERLDTNEKITLLDNIYMIEPHFHDMFINYAHKNGWETVYDDECVYDMEFHLEGDYTNSYVPYVDTLQEYDTHKQILSNYIMRGSVSLNDTDGGEFIEPVCDICDGTTEVECDECYGSVTVECERCDTEGKYECEICYGSGEDGERCIECEGTGECVCDSCNGTGLAPCTSCETGNIECRYCRY